MENYRPEILLIKMYITILYIESEANQQLHNKLSW